MGTIIFLDSCFNVFPGEFIRGLDSRNRQLLKISMVVPSRSNRFLKKNRVAERLFTKFLTSLIVNDLDCVAIE